MKCSKCGNEMKIALAAKVKCENCRILTTMTTIMTVQCEKCKSIFQIPLTTKSFLTVKKK